MDSPSCQKRGEVAGALPEEIRMDYSQYVAPAILFVIGFGGAVLARRVATWARKGTGPKTVPLKKGAVRLDHVPAKGKKRRRR